MNPPIPPPACGPVSSNHQPVRWSNWLRVASSAATLAVGLAASFAAAWADRGFDREPGPQEAAPAKSDEARAGAKVKTKAKP